MIGTTLYFCLSLVVVLALGLQLLNLVLIRINGKTTFGITFRQGTPERERAEAYASNTNIGITAAILPILIVHLIFVVHSLAMPRGKYSYENLMLLTAFSLLLTAIAFVATGRKTKQISDAIISGKHASKSSTTNKKYPRSL